MTTVGVVGTGVMGAGIAQVAAAHGCDVTLADVSEDVARKAVVGIGLALGRLVDRGKLPAGERDAVLGRLRAAATHRAFAGCDVIIEAVAEQMPVKVAVFQSLAAHARTDAVLASNTSSLSITRIGREAGVGGRLVGMHFFNPVPLMPLVEVIAGADTAPAAADRVADLARSWGKTVVRAKDTPGFIVNRVARGYYLEALRMLGEGVGGVADIDRACRDIGAFRMGPFELMDLVGIDVNYGVSESVWRQLGEPARLKPHPIQADLLAKGHLGRKTRRGFYSYDTDPPTPALSPAVRPSTMSPALSQAVALFASRASDNPGSPGANYVLGRCLAAIINEAVLAFGDGVATRPDIDTAMRLGTNYPHGPLDWAVRIGLDRCRDLLLALDAEAGDGRFTPAPLLAGNTLPT